MDINKRFDIRADHPLELEVRLDVFSAALGVRGGRVIHVSRSQGAAGEHLASVSYSLRLPRPTGGPGSALPPADEPWPE